VVDVSVCIPVFNEQLALRGTVLEIQRAMDGLDHAYEILLVDDGSTDGCMDQVRDLDVRIIEHRRNLGGGVARVTAIRHARGQLVLQTDADGTYPCDEIPTMLARMKTADMVIGARRRESAPDWRLLRVATKWTLKTLASLLVGRRIPDLNSGMRVYRREVALRYADLYPSGHSIMTTMTLAFLGDGRVVDFVAIDYNLRKGQSSFHPIRDTYNCLAAIVRTTRRSGRVGSPGGVSRYDDVVMEEIDGD